MWKWCVQNAIHFQRGAILLASAIEDEKKKDTIAVGIDATVASYKIEMKAILTPEFLSLKGFSPGHPRQS